MSKKSNLKGRKIKFGSWYQEFQLLAGWPLILYSRWHSTNRRDTWWREAAELMVARAEGRDSVPESPGRIFPQWPTPSKQSPFLKQQQGRATFKTRALRRHLRDKQNSFEMDHDPNRKVQTTNSPEDNRNKIMTALGVRKKKRKIY